MNYPLPVILPPSPEVTLQSVIAQRSVVIVSLSPLMRLSCAERESILRCVSSAIPWKNSLES